MPDAVIAVALFACWGTVVVVWVVGAIYNAVRAPSEPNRAALTSEYLAAVAVCAVLIVAGRRLGDHYLAFGAVWVRAIGLIVLVGSTLFALWARFSLGTSWSFDPQIRGDRRLHTDGPYAITRHPIYTGLLGMLLGSALLGGVGQWIVLPVAGLILLEVKIRQEERLLVTVFPEEYRAYRDRVPQLIPGLGALRRRSSPAVRP